MTERPKVSIVIPVYNGANYLGEAIDSALAQTYENVEVVVVNDGSTDDGATRQIALSYGDKIRYIEKENGGVSTALNRGLDEMTGDCFAWLSHDDLYCPDNLKRQVENLIAHDGSVVSACRTGILRGDTLLLPTHPLKRLEYESPLDLWRTWIYACSVVVPRACFDKIGRFNEACRTAQDVEFILLLLHSFRVVFVDEVLVHRRDHPESGYYSLVEECAVDNDELIRRLIDTYGIEFFHDERVVSCISEAVKNAKTYNALAFNHLLAPRASSMTEIFLDQSLDNWNSFANVAKIIRVVGLKRFTALARFVNRVKTKLFKQWRATRESH